MESISIEEADVRELDGMYQYCLYSDSYREKASSRNSEDASSKTATLILYCHKKEDGKPYEKEDFPESNPLSLSEESTLFGTRVSLEVAIESEEEEDGLLLLFKSNRNVIYARRQEQIFMDSLFPWTTPSFKEPSPGYAAAYPDAKEDSLFEKAGMETLLRYGKMLEELSFIVPGYLTLVLKTSENQTGRKFSPADFPLLGVTDVIEIEQRYPGGTFARRLILRIEEQTTTAYRDALAPLSELPFVYSAFPHSDFGK